MTSNTSDRTDRRFAQVDTATEQVEVKGAHAARSVTPRGAQARSARDDYITLNRRAWERWAPSYASFGRAAWVDPEPRWGLWAVPESELHLVDDLEPGAAVIELGCGTGGLSAALARRGLKPTGVDFARSQLVTAARLEWEFDVWFPLLHANAERLHFADETFDCAISEYGASLWCNPRRWLPEAARLLKPGGRLIFVTNSATLITCTPTDGTVAEDRLVRDYFSRYRVEFPGNEGAVEFHLTHGHWVRLLHATGFVLENLIETRPPPGAEPRYPFATSQWARRWPSEDIWVARKRS